MAKAWRCNGNQSLTWHTNHQLQDQDARKSATGLVFFSPLGKMKGIGKPFKDTWNLEVWWKSNAVPPLWWRPGTSKSGLHSKLLFFASEPFRGKTVPLLVYAMAYRLFLHDSGRWRCNPCRIQGSAKNSMETAMNNEVMWKSVPYYSKLGETNALDNRANGFFLCRQGRRYTKGAAQSSPWSQEILNHWPFGLSRVRSAVCLVNWFSFFRGLRCQKLRGLVHQPLLG